MEARRLILSLLERSVERRLSAREALAHPWFRKSLPPSTEPTYSTCNLDLLEKYQRGNNLIAIIENYLSLSEISQ
jgi:serine/threonine protein kinase